MLNLKRKETLSEDFAQAAEMGDVEWLKSTLVAGVDVDTTNVFGTTALMRASSRGDVEMVRVLLSYGADPNRVRNDKFTALALAAFFGHQSVVKCLVEHGADANASTRFGTSPEMWANARTFRNVARYLGDKDNAPAQITRRDNSAPVAVDDCSAKREERIPRSFSASRLSLRVALSAAVLLFVVAVAEVVIEHRQAPPATLNQYPQLATESIPVTTTIEQNTPEPATQPANTSANLNHAEDLGRRNSSPAKAHNRVAQSRAENNDAEEASAGIAEEPKIRTDVATRESTPPPIKVTVSRPVSSKPAASTSQLISPPANEKSKSKVIQWP
jgi:ankyrin repeat protein